MADRFEQLELKYQSVRREYSCKVVSDSVAIEYVKFSYGKCQVILLIER
jgi:hypothetical protein